MFTGLGFMAGPVIGGALFQVSQIPDVRDHFLPLALYREFWEILKTLEYGPL